MLRDNVTKTYKKSNIETVTIVNEEASEITEKLSLSDRVQCIAPNEAFITIKDHKPNFPNNIKCRLLNPCKSEIGKISKKYLENINESVRNALNVNQWRNTDSVLDWFKAINDKRNCHFIKFDIVSFYPSISKTTLMNALEFAKQHHDITEDMVKAITNSRKAFLYFEGNPWVKKDVEEHFDVTEGSFDGAEVCELVGLFMLTQLNELITDGSVGLYRDNGLAAVHRYSGPEMDRLRKRVIDLFRAHGFQITIDINLKTTDFLDVQLDLENDKYHPYKKPNDQPMYVHRDSNHPMCILKQLPKMTAQRLSDLSCNREEFDKSSNEYQEILKKSGFNTKLEYTPRPARRTRRRKTKVLWYNPPFDLQVKTNIGKTFLCLLDKHFPSHHRLHPIINRRCVKINYCCMPNIASHIKAHNRKILKEPTQIEPSEVTCNCQNADNCPLNGNCMQDAVVYKADVYPDVQAPEFEYYVGNTEPMFKGRWSDHNTSFRYERYRTKSKLSKHIWKLKGEGKDPHIKWSILRRCAPYRAGSKRCNLCLGEKYFIIKGDNKMINKKDELLGMCKHKDKFLLKNYKNRNRVVDNTIADN